MVTYLERAMSSLRASATIEPPGLLELLTGDGRSLPARLKAEIFREIDRLELVLRQISEVRSRIWMLTFASESASGPRLPTWQSPQIQMEGPAGSLPLLSSSHS